MNDRLRAALYWRAAFYRHRKKFIGKRYATARRAFLAFASEQQRLQTMKRRATQPRERVRLSFRDSPPWTCD